MTRRIEILGAAAVFSTAVGQAHAADPTPGYPEPVIHWVVQKGETCDTIAKAVYGNAKHVPLLGR